jgi:hypothetical protein
MPHNIKCSSCLYDLTSAIDKPCAGCIGATFYVYMKQNPHCRSCKHHDTDPLDTPCSECYDFSMQEAPPPRSPLHLTPPAGVQEPAPADPDLHIEVIRYGSVTLRVLPLVNDDALCGCGRPRVASLELFNMHAIDLCHKCLSDIMHCAIDLNQRPQGA